MGRQRTHVVVLVAALVVLAGAAAVGCRAANAGGPYRAVSLLEGAPAVPADEAPPPLPPQEQPALTSARAPTETRPQEEALVPTVPLATGQEPGAMEVLTSGPVHEAFAAPVDVQPEPGLVAPEEPPADIEEVPPAEQPEGADIVWVPGYWAWDADRAGYVWASGCWRAAPPDMHWEPGYWAAVPGGWQWVSGFWQQDSVQATVYLAEAPPVEDVQPPGPAPTEETVWVPPCPYWWEGRYVVRRGYWLTLRQGWVWVPSHYIWTPRGYIFIPGHWDFALDRRGVLFAPAYFPRSVYLRRGFTYSPIIVVELTLLTGDLFVYPRYCHYFFGDYYDDAYLLVGIYPWCDSIRIRKWYDPIYVYDRWRHRRTDPHWEQHKRNDYDRRRADKHLRPPRTYREMEGRLAGLPPSEQKGRRLARPLTSAVGGSEGPRRFRRISTDQERQRIAHGVTDARRTREERQQRESTGTGPRAGHPGPSARGQVTAPRAGERAAPTPTTGGRGTSSTGRGSRVAPTPATGTRVTPTPPREQVAPPSGRGERLPLPQGTRGRVSAPRGMPEPLVPSREPTGQTGPSREGRQPSPAPGRGPRAGGPPARPPQGDRGRRGPTLSTEQLRLQQWARDRQEAADRQRQQREASAEQARQQRWARDQQEAADRQRQQPRAALRARQQQDQQRRQQQVQLQRQQQEDQRRRQEQDRSRSRDDGSGRSSQDSSGDNGGGPRGRRSGR